MITTKSQKLLKRDLVMYEAIKANIRNVLKRKMAEKFFDVDQLAAASRVSTLTIKHILDPENDSMPAVKTLSKISRALGVRISVFFNSPNAAHLQKHILKGE